VFDYIRPSLVIKKEKKDMPTLPKILIDPSFRRMEEIFDPDDFKRLSSKAEIIWGKNDPAPEQVINTVRESVFAVVSPGWHYGSVSNFPQLHALLDVGGILPSPKALDYNECFSRGIRVLTCAPAFGPMVAEMALGMVIAAAREIVEGHNAFTKGEEKYGWDGNIDTYTLFDQRVGFIGFGGLARTIKPLLDPYHCHYQAFDPWLPDHFLRNQGVLPVGLDELLSSSKIIFVFAIPTQENKAMLDRDLLSKIQKGAILALMSRAYVVDFEALTDLLYQRRFKAVIDVFPQEPLPKEHPIRNAPGVILSAHRAGSVERDLRLIGHMAVDDLIAMISGLPPTEMQLAQPELVYKLR
jgi:phosphoglycerate dehydrogenase-like enzyme